MDDDWGLRKDEGRPGHVEEEEVERGRPGGEGWAQEVGEYRNRQKEIHIVFGNLI